jgi:hypothetical protein
MKMEKFINIQCEMRRQERNWIGHNFRRVGQDDSRIVLGWQPQGKIVRGGPKITRKKTVEKERITAEAC